MPAGVCYDINTGQILHLHYADRIEDLNAQASHNPDWAILEVDYYHPVFQVDPSGQVNFRVENNQIVSI